MEWKNDALFAASLDKADELRSFRERFHIPVINGKTSIYFTGNSLGLQPVTASAYVQQELNDWALLGVEGHFHAKHPWKPYHEMLTAPLAELVGAKHQEVVVMNSLTVNLHLLMVSFYRPTEKRFRIICEARAFPSDQYAFASQAHFHGLDAEDAVIEIKPREGEYSLRTEDIVATIAQYADSVALVVLGAVNYYTGQLYDIKAITKAAHDAGAYAGFDCAHAVGNVALKLHEQEVDFACWCSYKYLNSGPGGVAGIFIHEKHVANKDLPRFAGWWGQNKVTRFQMGKEFDPIPTAEGWQLSNAPILSMAVHKASLDIFEEAGMERLHTKRKMMAAYLRYLLDDINASLETPCMNIITPADENARGCQVSMLMLRQGKQVFEELSKRSVVADWREPDVIRVAPVPLYNSFTDIFQFAAIIKEILNS